MSFSGCNLLQFATFPLDSNLEIFDGFRETGIKLFQVPDCVWGIEQDFLANCSSVSEVTFASLRVFNFLTELRIVPLNQ
jgi:hypothetical protein